MTTVYVLKINDCRNYRNQRNIGIFSTKKKAVKYLAKFGINYNRQDYYCIEKWELDKAKGLLF